MFKIPVNKPRLYIALYPGEVLDNEEQRYHWSFLLGPKAEKQSEFPGTRYHIKNTPVEGWEYEEADLSSAKSNASFFARILIAKIEDPSRLVNIFRSTTVTRNDPDCSRAWIVEVLSRISQDGNAVGTAELDWTRIEALALDYVRKKTVEGRYAKADELLLPKPTWDMLQEKEIVS